jgi:hypothetical protein
MAKKIETPISLEGDHEPVHICFERIIPDELDHERPVRHAMRDVMLAMSKKAPDAEKVMQVSRMAVVNTKKWGSGAVVNCRFLDGTTKMRKKVEAIAHQWEQYGSFTFRFGTLSTAEIRISFYADAGSWSAVGRDALNRTYFPLHQPTMNYGWLRDGTSDTEYSRVVLHEFGHALGCIHEHQSPKFSRAWNKSAVMKYFQGPPNFWSPADIQHNVLDKYSPQGISATDFDKSSIMLYAFDGKLFSDGKGPTNDNTKLSAKDIAMIRSMYP